MGQASASPVLTGAWRAARANDTPSLVLNEYAAGRLDRFDPSAAQRFTPGTAGTWVVLTPPSTIDGGDRVLTINPPPWGAVTAYTENLAHAQTLALTDINAPIPGHGRLAWQLPRDAATATPILLKFVPSRAQSAPIRFQVQPLAEYLQDDASWLAFATACFAAMLTMVLMAMCFAVMLKDVTYAWYSGYILCYALILGAETGFMFQPLKWHWLIESAVMTHSAAVALSVAFAALFLTRFCELKHYAPLLRVPVLALAVGMIDVALLRISHIPILLEVERALYTPLLTLGAFLLLAASITAGVRGSRPAWLFFVGWMPLVLFTAANNAHLNGSLLGWTWPYRTGLALGAFEGILLSIGLADRALTSRLDRDEVRALADHDALTDVFNRRAWTEHASAALAASNARPMALLFLDLDHFKALNDRLGHQAGDHALMAVANTLKAELRPRDLLGRYGGEEFIVLLDATSATQAIDVGDRLRRKVHRLEIPASGDASFLTVSIGIAMHKSVDNLQALVERADQAMYRAKSSGRNRVVMHQTDMNMRSDRPSLIERRHRENSNASHS
ncbi:MAG: diguanylate cyclase [Rhodanobacter sp.]